MSRCLSCFLLVPGLLFGFTATKDTLYSPSLTTNPAYTSAQLKPSGSASTEVLDSIKFSGDARSSLGYLPMVQLEINGKIVECLDSTPCKNAIASKAYADTLNRINGSIHFKAMADCLRCPVDIRYDCPCTAPSCKNAILYTGQVSIFSGGKILNITLVGTSYLCGGSYANPFEPSSLAGVKKSGGKTYLPIHFEANGRKVSAPYSRAAPRFIRIE